MLIAASNSILSYAEPDEGGEDLPIELDGGAEIQETQPIPEPLVTGILAEEVTEDEIPLSTTTTTISSTEKKKRRWWLLWLW